MRIAGSRAGLTFVELIVVLVIAGVMILPKWVLKKLRMRVLEMGFGSEQGWRDLWQQGGISVRLASDASVECDSPEGDWEAFARHHLDLPDNP